MPERAEKFAEEIVNYGENIELTFQISIDDFSDNHDSVRKIKGLFDNCIDAYWRLK